MPGETLRSEPLGSDLEKEIERRGKERGVEAERAKQMRLMRLTKGLYKEPSQAEKGRDLVRREKWRRLAEKLFRAADETRTKNKGLVDPELAEFLQKSMGAEAAQDFNNVESETAKSFVSAEDRIASCMRLYDALRQEKDLEKQYQLQEEILLKLQEIFAQYPDLTGDSSQKMTEQVDARKKEIKAEIAKVSDQSPEAFLGISIKELREYKRQLEEGEIIETPWVKERIEQITELLAACRPVLLYGETGTGKTEVAKKIAMDTTGKKALVLRGHRFMTQEEVWGYLGLSPVAAKKLSEAEISKKIREKNPEFDENEMKAAVKACGDAMEGKTESTAVETKYFAGIVEQAAEEGRVLIIDEFNYIQPGLLASFNEILANSKPGQEVTIPVTGKKVKIAKGFGIVMTGNITLDGVKRYTDRFKLEPALKDRLSSGFIEYNTPPQETDPGKNCKDAVNKDLFLIAMAELADRKGNLSLPEGYNRRSGLEQVWRLCQAFKLFQDNFAGKSRTPIKMGDKMVGVVLAENHASLRKLRNILKNWRDGGLRGGGGTRCELDYYVYEELIRPAMTEPSEADYFYTMLQDMYGFFPSKGETKDYQAWEDRPKYKGEPGEKFDVKVPASPNAAKDPKFVSTVDVAESIRGKKMPTEALKSEEQLDEEKKAEIMLEMQAEVQKMKDAWQAEWDDISKCCPPEEAA